MHDLARVLDLVRDTVLHGDLNQLSPLTEQIGHLLGNATQMPESEMAMIRAKANQNLTTLNAAIQGVRAAQRRLTELREASTGHRTYGPGGGRSAVANLSTTLKQRI